MLRHYLAAVGWAEAVKLVAEPQKLKEDETTAELTRFTPPVSVQNPGPLGLSRSEVVRVALGCVSEALPVP